MEISEVRVKLVNNPKERLKAFCSITLENDFVIRDLKVIDGTNGTFVAMPSRKLCDRCSSCGHKNHLKARFCNECGKKLNDNRKGRGNGERMKLHADIAHPINATCRERIQTAVVEAYQAEVEKSKLPGYKPAEFDEELDSYEDEAAPEASGARHDESTPVRDKSPRREERHSHSGYDELIAELKQDAAKRRETHNSSNDSYFSRFNQEEDKNDIGEEDLETSASNEVIEELAPTKPLSPQANEPSAKTSSDDFGAGIL